MINNDLRVKISEILDKAKRLSLCCDVWTKQGMTESFWVSQFNVFSAEEH